jgi:hypothetical protein
MHLEPPDSLSLPHYCTISSLLQTDGCEPSTAPSGCGYPQPAAAFGQVGAAPNLFVSSDLLCFFAQ